jgi:hypothetical protein
MAITAGVAVHMNIKTGFENTDTIPPTRRGCGSIAGPIFVQPFGCKEYHPIINRSNGKSSK